MTLSWLAAPNIAKDGRGETHGIPSRPSQFSSRRTWSEGSLPIKRRERESVCTFRARESNYTGAQWLLLGDARTSVRARDRIRRKTRTRNYVLQLSASAGKYHGNGGRSRKLRQSRNCVVFDVRFLPRRIYLTCTDGVFCAVAKFRGARISKSGPHFDPAPRLKVAPRARRHAHIRNSFAERLISFEGGSKGRHRGRKPGSSRGWILHIPDFPRDYPARTTENSFFLRVITRAVAWRDATLTRGS